MEIGKFIHSDSEEGHILGVLKTLTLNRTLRFIPRQMKSKDGMPDYDIYVDEPAMTEVGAGWKKTAKSTGNAYIQVVLDDPAFAQTLYARMSPDNTDSDADFVMYWDRQKDS